MGCYIKGGLQKCYHCYQSYIVQCRNLFFSWCSMGIVFMLLLTPFKNIAGIKEDASLMLFKAFRSAHPFVAVGVCTIRAIQEKPKVINDASASEARLCRVQFGNFGRWFVEVSVNGSFTDGDGRLVSERAGAFSVYCQVKTLSNICFTGTRSITVLMRLYYTCDWLNGTGRTWTICAISVSA